MVIALFAFLCFGISLYCILAIIFNVPSFRAAKAYRHNDNNRKSFIQTLFGNNIKTIAQYIPLNPIKEMDIKKRLMAAKLDVTPKEYVAEALLYAFLFLLAAIPFYILNKYLAFLPVGFSIFMFIEKFRDLDKMGSKRREEIEREIPTFCSYMASSLQSNRNILSIIDTYRANYQTALTEELSITAWDMRTGNMQLALERMEGRINSPFVSQLVRGMVSALNGDDMTAYFQNLCNEMSEEWRQRLKKEVLKKEPKIMRKAYLLFACSIISIMVLMISALLSSSFMDLGL